MRRSDKPSRPRQEIRDLALPAIQLEFHVDDASFIDAAESDRRRQPSLARSHPVLRSIAVTVVAAALGWTVYYDLLGRRPLPLLPPSPARTELASAARERFPSDGTMVADFQPSEALGAGLTLQMPADDLRLLFVVVFEDWRTGAAVAHTFLRANTVATFRLPPGRYRIVAASGHVWRGVSQLFGSETRVLETIGPVAASMSESGPSRLVWGYDPRYPIAQVPIGLFDVLLSRSR